MQSWEFDAAATRFAAAPTPSGLWAAEPFVDALGGSHLAVICSAQVAFDTFATKSTCEAQEDCWQSTDSDY
jgi:hypothetical protein